MNIVWCALSSSNGKEENRPETWSRKWLSYPRQLYRSSGMKSRTGWLRAAGFLEPDERAPSFWLNEVSPTKKKVITQALSPASAAWREHPSEFQNEGSPIHVLVTLSLEWEFARSIYIQSSILIFFQVGYGTKYRTVVASKRARHPCRHCRASNSNPTYTSRSTMRKAGLIFKRPRCRPGSR